MQFNTLSPDYQTMVLYTWPREWNLPTYCEGINNNCSSEQHERTKWSWDRFRFFFTIKKASKHHTYTMSHGIKPLPVPESANGPYQSNQRLVTTNDAQTLVAYNLIFLMILYFVCSRWYSSVTTQPQVADTVLVQALLRDFIYALR